MKNIKSVLNLALGLVIVILVGFKWYQIEKEAIEGKHQKALVEFYFPQQHGGVTDNLLQTHIAKLYDEFVKRQSFTNDSQLKIKQFVTNKDFEVEELEALYLFSDKDNNVKGRLKLKPEETISVIWQSIEDNYMSEANDYFAEAFSDCDVMAVQRSRKCLHDIGYLNAVTDVQQSIDQKLAMADDENGFDSYWAVIYGNFNHIDKDLDFVDCHDVQSRMSLTELKATSGAYAELLARYKIQLPKLPVSSENINILFVSNDDKFGYRDECKRFVERSQLRQQMQAFWTELFPEEVNVRFEVTPELSSNQMGIPKHYFFGKNLL